MPTPFLGQISMVAFNFAPQGWALCNGQILPIDQFTALFQLLGTTYGGDGQTTFGLPDLRGRVPIHQGPSFVIGQVAGTENVTLTAQQIPSHTHVPTCNTSGSDSTTPVNAVWGSASSQMPYHNGAQVPGATMLAPTLDVNNTGALPHENLMPFLCINYIIALEGIFPSQN